MATVDSPRTNAFAAASRALDRAIETAVGESPTHPSGTTFVPADLAASGRVPGYRRLGPVSIIDADGNETRLPQDHFREIAVVALLAGIVLWALARRSRVVL
jgi:hypothetical protein